MSIKAVRFGVLLCGLAVAMVAVVGCGQGGGTPKDRVENKSKDEKKPADHSGWWCEEHGIPEAECSLCQDSAAKACKAKGDWCEEHGRAKSQCFKCDPSLKEKFAKIYRAKEGKDPPPFDDY